MREKKTHVLPSRLNIVTCAKKNIQNKKLPQEQENERRKLHIDQRLKHVFVSVNNQNQYMYVQVQHCLRNVLRQEF